MKRAVLTLCSLWALAVLCPAAPALDSTKSFGPSAPAQPFQPSQPAAPAQTSAPACDDAVFCVDFSRKKPRTKPPKDNFWTHIIKGHIDQTFCKPVDYSVLPIPTYIAEGGFGAGLQGSLLYRLDRTDSVMQPSCATLFASLNQSLFVRVDAYGQNFFAGRKHRIIYDFQYWWRRSLKFWGISYEDCYSNNSRLYDNMRFAGNINYMYNVTSNLFVGATLNLNYTQAGKVRGGKTDPAGAALDYAVIR